MALGIWHHVRSSDFRFMAKGASKKPLAPPLEDPSVTKQPQSPCFGNTDGPVRVGKATRKSIKDLRKRHGHEQVHREDKEVRPAQPRALARLAALGP